MRVILGICLLVSIFLVSGCEKDQKAAILFSPEPINLERVEFQNVKPTFKVRDRVYFILLSEEAIEADKLRVQALRLDMKYPFYKMEIPYSIDVARGEKTNYFTDYLVLHKKGTYFLRIFSHDDFEKPIAEAEFMVEDL